MVNVEGLYNPEYGLKKISSKYFCERTQGFRIIENGIVLPYKLVKPLSWGVGGIIDAEGKYITSSFLMEIPNRGYIPEEVKTDPSTVIYIGMFFSVWGHCLTDNIRRIWFLKSDIYKKNFRSCPIIYNPMQHVQGRKIPKNFWRLLEILEVEPEKFQPIKFPTKYKKIILPDMSWTRVPPSFTKEYSENIEQVRNYAKKIFVPLSQKKFYFHYSDRYVVGAERLAEYFKSKNYDVVKPEKLTLEEQLNILANCEKFASTDGSSSHNSVFMNDNTEVLLIPRSSTKAFTETQRMLNEIRKQNIFYVDSSLSIFGKSDGKFFCFLISEQLRKFFKEKVSEKFAQEDFETFFNYLEMAIQDDIEIRQGSRAYYIEVMSTFWKELKRHPNLDEKYKDFIASNKQLENVLKFFGRV